VALLASEHQNTRDADGLACAEGAGNNPPRSPVPSDFTDELPSVVASVERINAWIEVAKPGDRFTYASRATLPIASAGAKRMRELAARDLVCLTRPRSTIDQTIFNYQATRTSVPTALTKPVRPTLTPRLIDAEVALVDALLPVLARLASFGRPCPTNKQLAARSGVHVDRIDDALEALTLAGLIRVLPLPRPTMRRIVIVATGQQTGVAA